MKKLMLVLAGLFLATNAFAFEFNAQYDYYKTPNGGNNYDDAQGFSLGVKHDIHKDIKGRLDLSHIGDIDFPSVDDPKGSFGTLRGYGAIYNVILELPYSDALCFELSAGAGPYWWDFRENPFLQDHNVNVSVDTSVAFKAGAGVSYKLKDDWQIVGRVGWFDTNIGKDARDAAGTEWNILDGDGNIGLQYITFSVGVSHAW